MKRADAPMTTSDLRKFGLVTGAMFALVFGLVLPWLWGRGFPQWPWWLAGGFGGLGAIAPVVLRPVYRVWMGLAAVLGWINTRIILSLAFYLLIFPGGMMLRLLGRDAMARRLEPESKTYRTESQRSASEQMEKPF